jgi:hypothetical protein
MTFQNLLDTFLKIFFENWAFIWPFFSFQNSAFLFFWDLATLQVAPQCRAAIWAFWKLYGKMK